MENTDQFEEEDSRRVDSAIELASTSSSDVSAASGGSGEIQAVARRRKCVGRSNRGVAWGFTSMIGRRREMEDAVAVVPGFMALACDHVGGCTAAGARSSADISPVHFFGVYDGHGGSQVAKFCAERMHQVVAEEWDRETADGLEWRQRWEAALSSSFERADNEVVMEAVAPEMVGSTSVVAVLSSCQIIISNCGDSRAVLCRGNETIPLTFDQKPDREDELMRIEGEGGKVINWNGARVFGVLAMSRAIGDRYLRPWIIPVPEVTFTTRTEEDECLILASDGLWDVMSNDEVGEVARRLLRRWRRPTVVEDQIPVAQAVADNLTEISLARNSSDNISIVVVNLKSKRKRLQRR
ncbi:probable protein phosphatase 2C 6 [Actinidia eriantha]|uniref:probable protein phosphatase 2C 6 n=1 Tax=Actinidia eriantha TaxID=165200 RepID=UPI002589864C|nr:probable protein phosphatase 2C 6 [Actinidia eriantha]